MPESARPYTTVTYRQCPWQNPGRILSLLPVVYAVWWKRNIYLGMAVHCLGNIAAMLILLAAILG